MVGIVSLLSTDARVGFCDNTITATSGSVTVNSKLFNDKLSHDRTIASTHNLGDISDISKTKKIQEQTNYERAVQQRDSVKMKQVNYRKELAQSRRNFLQI